MKKQILWIIITVLLVIAILLVTPYVFQFLMIPIVIKRQAFYPTDGVIVFILWFWPAMYIASWSHANSVIRAMNLYHKKRRPGDA